MASQDVEDVVAEEPATHKLKAQKWIVLLAVSIVGALFVSVAVKLVKKPTLPVVETKKTDGIKTTSPNSEDDFQQKLAQEEKRRALMQKAAEEGTGNNDDAIARLEALRNEAAAKAGEPRTVSDKSAGDGVKSAKSPLTQWEDNELLRAMNSRKSGIAVQLVGSGVGASTDKRAPQIRDAVQRTSGAPLIPGMSALQTEQQGVQTELARVEALRKQLESGGVSAGDLEQSFSGLASGGTAAEASPVAAAVAPASRQGQTVGQPASVAKTRKPGDVLVSVGTVGRAVLDQDVISDYPGPWRGLLIDNIYDVTNHSVVIPKGSRIVGNAVHITNVNEPISARMGLLVKWIVLPDGSKISMDRTAALDAAGVAGIKDKVNRHIFAQVMGVAAYAMVSSETSRTGTSGFEQSSFEGDLGDSLRKQFAPIAQKYLNLVPTITLRGGTPIRIFIEDDIFAQPWSEVNADLVKQVAR